MIMILPVSLTIEGLAAHDAFIDIIENETTLGSGQANDSGEWQVPVDPDQGFHSIQARAYYTALFRTFG